MVRTVGADKNTFTFLFESLASFYVRRLITEKDTIANLSHHGWSDKNICTLLYVLSTIVNTTMWLLKNWIQIFPNANGDRVDSIHHDDDVYAHVVILREQKNQREWQWK